MNTEDKSFWKLLLFCVAILVGISLYEKSWGPIIFAAIYVFLIMTLKWEIGKTIFWMTIATVLLGAGHAIIHQHWMGASTSLVLAIVVYYLWHPMIEKRGASS